MYFSSGLDDFVIGRPTTIADAPSDLAYAGVATPEGTVANQVQIINSAVNSGADAIAISSVSSDGLNQALQKALDAGIKVVTWDSDVDPKYRSVYSHPETISSLSQGRKRWLHIAMYSELHGS